MIILILFFELGDELGDCGDINFYVRDIEVIYDVFTTQSEAAEMRRFES